MLAGGRLHSKVLQQLVSDLVVYNVVKDEALQVILARANVHCGLMRVVMVCSARVRCRGGECSTLSLVRSKPRVERKMLAMARMSARLRRAPCCCRARTKAARERSVSSGNLRRARVSNSACVCTQHGLRQCVTRVLKTCTTCMVRCRVR